MVVYEEENENPFVGDYAPETDEDPALDQDLESWYHYLIGTLRWMVEIGRVDIITDMSVMASQMDMPREGNLEAVLHVFVFLCQKYN